MSVASRSFPISSSGVLAWCRICRADAIAHLRVVCAAGTYLGFGSGRMKRIRLIAACPARGHKVGLAGLVDGLANVQGGEDQPKGDHGHQHPSCAADERSPTSSGLTPLAMGAAARG